MMHKKIEFPFDASLEVLVIVELYFHFKKIYRQDKNIIESQFQMEFCFFVTNFSLVEDRKTNIEKQIKAIMTTITCCFSI